MLQRRPRPPRPMSNARARPKTCWRATRAAPPRCSPRSPWRCSAAWSSTWCPACCRSCRWRRCRWPRADAATAMPAGAHSGTQPGCWSASLRSARWPSRCGPPARRWAGVSSCSSRGWWGCWRMWCSRSAW